MTNLLSGLASPAPQPLSAHAFTAANRASERGRSEPGRKSRSGDWHCLSDAKYILEIRSLDSPARLHASNRLVRSL
jgi:hypothetical protein